MNFQKNITDNLDTVKKFVKCQLFTFMCQNQYFVDCSFKCSLSGISMCCYIFISSPIFKSNISLESWKYALFNDMPHLKICEAVKEICDQLNAIDLKL